MAGDDLRKRIDFLEETYEFLLSYAARGLTGRESSGSGELRDYLSDAAKIAGELPELFREAVSELEPDSKEPFESYGEVLASDADATRRALELVLAQPSISSQLIDNLNASIHFRALLTDLFLVDEIFNPRHVRKAEAKAAKAEAS
ncbi:MAG: hypothetical protein R3223_08735 [Longimicrobiales bacterium]|nr:hypothetical protein [Longimicrobiales bacterium]